MLVFKCPNCNSPLVYYKNRCFIISKKQIEKISKTKSDSSIIKILDNITKKHSKKTIKENSYLSQDALFNNSIYKDDYNRNFSRNSNYITKDDIINLKIELETCTDCKQFIDKI
jgi:ssDNA-binding Zn-finger/Zn-ribbon topoisomerase 1